MHVCVIGAGFGGLAAALRLRALGHEVTVLERLPEVGGRASPMEVGGRVFDAGPTVITAPQLFEALFELFGERLQDHVDMLPVRPWYRMRFADGSSFDYGPDMASVEREVERFAPDDLKGYRRYRRLSRRLYRVGYEKYGRRPFHRLTTMLGAIPALLRLRAYRSVFDTVAAFVRDPRLRAALSVPPLLIGGNPFTTTSVYALIHWLEMRDGIWFARGGTRALVAALADLAVRHGVRIRTLAAVQQIVIRAGRVCGVALGDGSHLSADAVVANADAPAVYRYLIDKPWRPRWTDARLRRLRFSMGLYVLYFVTDRRYADVPHHTILFGKDFRQHIDAVYNGGGMPDDPCIYLHRPTATDDGIAPPGEDHFYALVPVPHLADAADDGCSSRALKQAVLDRLEATCLPALGAHIVATAERTPTYFRDQLGSIAGAGFSVQPLLRQSAWFRFHNIDTHIENLYFVGAGTHPGAGVPGVLASAHIVADAVARSSGRVAA